MLKMLKNYTKLQPKNREMSLFDYLYNISCLYKGILEPERILIFRNTFEFFFFNIFLIHSKYFLRNFA